MIPEGWKEALLADLATISMGQSPSSSSYNDVGDGLYLIQGNADIKNRESSPRIWTKNPTKKCAPDDILMTVRAPVGAIAISKHEACIGRGVCAIRPIHADAGFLKQYLISYEPKWKKFEQGSTFTAVGSKEVKELPILLPPLPEQRRIASILSSVDDAIQATQRVIDQTERVKRGLLQELLTRGIGHTDFKQTEIGEIPKGWEVVETSSLCEQISVGIVVKPSQYYVSEGVKCFRSANIGPGYVNDSDWVYISPESNQALSKSRLQTGDVLVVRTGYPGTACVVTEKFSGTNCIDVIFARPDESKIRSYFLSLFINSPLGKGQILAKQGGLAQKHFNVGYLKIMKVALPPLSEQDQIIKKIHAVQETVTNLMNTQKIYKDLKTGLMKDLLSGTVRVAV